jgi:hypothetical protein
MHRFTVPEPHRQTVGAKLPPGAFRDLTRRQGTRGVQQAAHTLFGPQQLHQFLVAQGRPADAGELPQHGRRLLKKHQ